jgi:hypothetical protein
MTFGSKMNYKVTVADQGVDQFGIADIAIPELKPGVPASLYRKALGIPRVCQHIEY